MVEFISYQLKTACCTTLHPVEVELHSFWYPSRISTRTTIAFTIYKRFVKDIGSNICPFADDTRMYIIADDPVAAVELLNLDLDKITKWAKDRLVKFNPKNMKVF